MNKKSFILIELLVVIAIIGVIAALLLPVFGKAREGARTAMCANNLRQIGLAIHMYIDDHGQILPPALNGVDWNWDSCWVQELFPYLDNREIFKCPSFKPYPGWAEEGWGGDLTSYGYNMRISSLSINRIKSTSKCIMVSDCDDNDPPVLIWSVSPRHSGGTNIVFFDGHVSWYRSVDIPQGSPQYGNEEYKLWWNY